MTSESHFFSIVMPVYNYAHTVERAVQSVLAQSYSNWELILVDDGSTDNSAAVCSALAEKYSRIRFIQQHNAGAAAARNHGIRLASGTFLTFLDADDALAADALQAVRVFLDEHTGCDVVIGGHHAIEPSGQSRYHAPGAIPAAPAERLRAYLIDKKIRISNGAIFMHRKVFSRGVFPENFRNGEDIPVFAQALTSFNAQALDQALVLVHKHADSLRNQTAAAIAGGMQLVEEIFNAARLPEEAMVLRKRYAAQRALSLMRSLYLADKYTEALSMYRVALQHAPQTLFKWSYTRKALRSWWKAGQHA